jgi:hypothetical protein
MAGKIRWGILATGWIADLFVKDLQLTGHCVSAVGSRTEESAKRFAKQFGIAAAHGSYAALAADPNVDVIYVATPHPQHASAAKLALTSNMRRTAWSAAFEEMPAGLSSGSSPSMRRRVRAIGANALAFVRRIDQLRQARAPLDGFVLLEVQLGSGVQLDAPAQLGAEKSGRAAQARARLLYVPRIQAGEENRRVGAIGGNIHRGQRDHADARIAQFALDDLGKLALDLVAHLLRAC